MPLHTSNPASIRQTVGGVGHNVALAAHLASTATTVRLCSLVGDDEAGNMAMASLERVGLNTAYVRQLSRGHHVSRRTAQYVAINEADKSLLVAMSDMDIFTHHSFPDFWKSAVAGTKPQWLVVDGNWSENDIRAWIEAGRENNCSIAFEPVSTAKSTRLFGPSLNRPSLGVYPNHSMDLATPNQLELVAMHEAAKENGYLDQSSWPPVVDAFGIDNSEGRLDALKISKVFEDGMALRCLQLLPYIPTILTKLGSDGVLLTTILGRDDPRLKEPNEEPHIFSRGLSRHSHVGGLYMRLFPAAERVEDVVSVNGVGDTFLGVLVAGLARGGRIENLVDVAQRGAVLTLKSPESVSPDLGWLEGQLADAVRKGE
jgi:pseudouridylate synthase / pseudouridine kinase